MSVMRNDDPRLDERVRTDAAYDRALARIVAPQAAEPVWPYAYQIDYEALLSVIDDAPWLRV